MTTKPLDIDRADLMRRPFEVDQYFIEAIAKGVIVLSGGEATRTGAHDILNEASKHHGKVRVRYFIQRVDDGYRLSIETCSLQKGPPATPPRAPARPKAD